VSDNVLRFDFLARDQASGTFKKLEGESEGLGGKLSKFGGLAFTALKTATVAAAGLGVAGAVMGVKTAAGLEQAQLGFTTLLHSGTQATAFLNQLKVFSTKTPFRLNGLIEASRTLINVGLNTKQTMVELQDFGDAASAVGVSQENFQRIMLATSKAIGEGRFQTRSLNEITADGLPVWTILSKQMGKPIPVLREMAQKGQLLASTTLPLLNTAMHKDYGGDMARQAMSLNGLMSTLFDTLTNGLSTAVQPFIPALEKGASGAIGAVGKALDALPSIEHVFSGPMKAAGKIADALKPEVVKGLGQLEAVIKSDATKAKTWGGVYASAIKSGVKIGLATGDWAPLGRTIGTAISKGWNTFWHSTPLSIKALTSVFSSNKWNSIGLGAGAAWASSILDGITLGFKSGDWSSLGTTLGTGLGNVIVKMGDISGSILKWFAGQDWDKIGAGMGLAALPAIIGFISHFGTNIVSVVKKHPMDALMFVASLLAVGKIADVFLETLRAIPFVGRLAEFVAWLTRPFNKVIGKVFTFIADALREGISRPFDAFGVDLFAKFKWIADEVAQRATYMKDAGVKFFHGLFADIGEIIGWITKEALDVIGDLLKPFADADKWLIGTGTKLIRGLVDTIRGNAKDGVTIMKWAIEKVRAPWDGAGEWLVKAGRDVIERFVGAVRGGGSDISGIIKWAIQKVRSPWTNAKDWLYQAGRNIIGSLVQGMRNMGPAATGMAKDVAGDVVRAVKNFFGIHSPSKVFGDIGHNLMHSLFHSMTSHNPVSVVNKIFGSMPDALSSLVDKSLVSVEALPDKAMSALSKVKGWFTGGGSTAGSFPGGVSSAEKWIINAESGNRTTAQNPTSTAFGLGQLLIANREHYGAILGVSPSTTNYGAQLAMMRMYIKDRYGNAENAERFHMAHGWYDSGGVATGSGYLAKKTLEPERVLSPAQTKSFDRLTRVLARSTTASNPPAGQDIDYTKLGAAVAKAFTQAGVTVKMDGKAVGKVMGNQANLLGRAG
jgi:tape measure domain-containing protein